MIHFAIEQVNILFSIQRVSSFKKKIEYKKEIGIKSNLLRYFLVKIKYENSTASILKLNLAEKVQSYHLRIDLYLF